MKQGRPIEIRLPTGTAIRYADEKAALFFVVDRSAAGARSYDAWIASSSNHPHAFTDGDLRVVNATMGGRTARHHWERFTTGTDLGWLAAIPQQWDLVRTPEREWNARACESRIREALEELMGSYRRAAVVSKLLHIKRPRLVPICDSYVASTMKMRPRDAEGTLSLILAIREVGLANVRALDEIAARLRSVGIERSLVRILDVLLWFDAPYSGPPGPYAVFEEWLTTRHGGRLFF